MSIEVRVSAPSRLHFGIIDMRGDLGRIHGSVGVAIEQPDLILEAKSAKELMVKGVRGEKVSEYARNILRDFGISDGAQMQIVRDIPVHSGFGSGTQLALAVGTVLSKLYDISVDIEEVAVRLGRSRISGVGTYAFKQGGFIVDGGHRVDNPLSIPPLVFHSPLPENWMFVVGLPKIDSSLSGSREKEAFKNLEPPPKSMVKGASHLVLMKMIPAVIERDIEAFGEAITALDSTFGDYWIKIQGGRYSHPVIERAVMFLLEAGSHGVGQSSWGPALYGLVEGEKQAIKVSEELKSFFNSEKVQSETFYTKPDNSGAKISVVED